MNTSSVDSEDVKIPSGEQERLKHEQTEIDKLLSDTTLAVYKPIIKDWYNGYRFGQMEIYFSWGGLNLFYTLSSFLSSSIFYIICYIFSTSFIIK